MLMLTLVVSVAGYAQTEIDGIYYNLDNEKLAFEGEGEAQVTHGEEKYVGDVVIPSTLNYYGLNYKVTNIGFRAFSLCSNLSSVTIPNSVTSIGATAFYECI